MGNTQDTEKAAREKAEQMSSELMEKLEAQKRYNKKMEDERARFESQARQAENRRRDEERMRREAESKRLEAEDALRLERLLILQEQRQPTSGSRFPCPYSNLGCEGYSSVADKITHIQSCSFRPINHYNPACDYSRFGCNVTLSTSERVAHIASCSFRILPCPVQPCSWRGSYHVMYQHAVENHKMRTAQFGVKNRVPLGNGWIKLLWHADVLFILHQKAVGDSTAWLLQALTSMEDERPWRYEISVVDPNDRRRSVGLWDCCVTEGADIGAVVERGECAQLPHYILRNYLQNNLLSITINIYKKS